MFLTSLCLNHRATRIFIWCYIVIAIVSYTALKFYYVDEDYSKSQRQEQSSSSTVRVSPLLNSDKPGSPKYILVWPNVTNFKLLEKGDKTFIINNCEYRNCFATDDAHLLSSVKEFNAVVINGWDANVLQQSELLKERSPSQMYVFAAYESAAYIPVCFDHFDGFFNLTWTYKLDSDIVATYFNVYDLEGETVGPRINMEWVNKMHPINEELKSKLSHKTKAAAWFVSRCITLSEREEFVKNLRVQLAGFGLTVDIYGDCGFYKCPDKERGKCDKLVQEDYFFYLAFENSLASDYVTEDVARALNNYAVPIVFGGADYTRFVPEGTYLDARQLGEPYLAYKMDEIINNITAYHDFFRWRNHYVYLTADQALRKDVCQLCAMLNDRELMSDVTVWKHFRQWWNKGTFDCQYHEFFN